MTAKEGFPRIPRLLSATEGTSSTIATTLATTATTPSAANTTLAVVATTPATTATTLAIAKTSHFNITYYASCIGVTRDGRERSAAFTPLQRANHQRAGPALRLARLDVEAG